MMITPEEHEVLRNLTRAWFSFKSLERLKEDDGDWEEFWQAIRQCQRIVAFRSVVRDEPEFWEVE